MFRMLYCEPLPFPTNSGSSRYFVGTDSSIADRVRNSQTEKVGCCEMFRRSGELETRGKRSKSQGWTELSQTELESDVFPP